MDFHALLAKMQEIERRQDTTVVPEQVSTTECGPMPTPSMTTPPMGRPETPPPPPPSMSVNLNAQGMDNIKDMLNLWMKVNPDMMPKDPAPMPSIMPEPSITSIKPSLPPLKMLPDLDGPDKSKEIEIKLGGPGDMEPGDMDSDDMDSDDMGPDDMDKDDMDSDDMDSDDMGPDDMDKDDMDSDDKPEKEAWENEPDTDVKSVDYMNNKLAGGMNKPKDTFPKVAGADNPMQRIRENDDDMKTRIKEELRKRLAEAKGVK